MRRALPAPTRPPRLDVPDVPGGAAAWARPVATSRVRVKPRRGRPPKPGNAGGDASCGRHSAGSAGDGLAGCPPRAAPCSWPVQPARARLRTPPCGHARPWAAEVLRDVGACAGSPRRQGSWRARGRLAPGTLPRAPFPDFVGEGQVHHVSDPHCHSPAGRNGTRQDWLGVRWDRKWGVHPPPQPGAVGFGNRDTRARAPVGRPGAPSACDRDPPARSAGSGRRRPPR